jgi:putative ABC transport system permease protein
MIKHYFKTAFRYLLRNRGLTIINILGLAIGICVFILIMHYVGNELSYDKFISRQETLCRLEFDYGGQKSSWTTSAMGYDLVEAVPEALSFVRVKPGGSTFMEYNEIKYQVQTRIFADSNFIRLFDLELISGNPVSALSEPATAIITESLARKIFGGEEALGKILISAGGGQIPITGVVRDPGNFHIPFDMVISFVTLGAMYGDEHLYNYKTFQYDTYIELMEKVRLDSLNPKVNQHAHEKSRELYGDPDEDEDEWTAYLRPVKDVYFAREVRDGGAFHGNIQFVYIFIIIAAFIILIACINFINISTARASMRALEVGIKKVVGSGKNKLILHFLTESLLITLMAGLLGLLLVEVVFPEFERIVGSDLRIAYLENPANLLLLLLGVLILGIAAGAYPAFYLTAFRPVNVLKGNKSHGRSAKSLRKFLIVFQFTISITLIIGTLVVYSQLLFLKNKDLGFNKDHIVTIHLNRVILQNQEIFRENLMAHPQIERVSYSYMVPGAGDNWEGFSLDGQDFSTVVYLIDPDYLDVMGIEMVDGRNFSWDLITDKQNACLVNETLAADLETDSLVGKHFDHPQWYITAIPAQKIPVIGIVKDFHYKSLREEIGPLMFVWGDEWVNYINIRIQPDNVPGALEVIEKEWKSLCPQYPFNYSFMDENFERMYRSDQKLGKIFSYFAALAIFIAILGLFGLAAFIAEQRTREIGIRKAMGASVTQVSFLIVKEFSWLVIAASALSWILAWIWAKNWLQEFAYRIHLNIWIFVLATILALLVAWITVLSQTIKAAYINPADSLRYE